MTYRRQPGSWAAIATDVVGAIGEAECAARCGVSRSRLQQLKNPMRDDWRTLDLALRLDGMAAEAGLGHPFADEMRQRLGATPVSPPVPGAVRAAVAAAVAGLRRIADGLAAAVEDTAGPRLAA